MNRDAISPELQLLLVCARADLSRDPKATRQAQQLVASALNWPELAELAARHRLTPLLYQNLRSLGPESPPVTEFLQSLREEFQVGAARNFCLTSQLLEILAVFQKHEIAALAYKGPALAVVAYANPLLRSFCDLDLLLKPADLPRAGALLAQCGFKRAIHAGVEDNDYAEKWERQEGNVVVELHWDVLPRHEAVPLALEKMWQAPMTVEVAGAKIFTPAMPQLVLLQAWHGYKHRWQGLEASATLAACLEREPFDWPELMRLAQASGSRRVLFLALSLATDIFEARIPEEVLRQMQEDKQVQMLADQTKEKLFSLDNRQPMDLKWFHLRSRERLRDKSRYLWRLAQSEPEAVRKLPGLLTTKPENH